MGGKVLEYEGRNIFYEDFEQGRSETLNADIYFTRSNGMSECVTTKLMISKT